MTAITTIFNKLEREDKTFLISIYEETGDNNARFQLGYYLCSVFDSDFTTFEESCYSTVELTELGTILKVLAEKDTLNIIRLMDLVMALQGLKEELDIPNIEMNHDEVMTALNELKKETEKSNEEYITIADIATLLKKSKETLYKELFDPSLLNPFKRKENAKKIVLKKKDVIKWFDSNF